MGCDLLNSIGETADDALTACHGDHSYLGRCNQILSSFFLNACGATCNTPQIATGFNKQFFIVLVQLGTDFSNIKGF
jgi:hypothetical protein